jgi:REP element-mobilizing transposase RayT
MKFYENKYYHLFNRTNNEEALFRTEENYLYFLKKYRFYLDEYFETIGYCLMPTHFHFLVRVKEIKIEPSEGYPTVSEGLIKINRIIGTFLNSYSQAFNKMWNRHGNLFNQKTNAKNVESEKYLITLLTYIHQNPIRSKLVDKAEDWDYSSYRDYIDFRNGTLPKMEIILENIKKEDLKEFTNRKLISNSGLKE